MKKQGRPCIKLSVEADVLDELKRVYATASCPKDRQKAHAVLLAATGNHTYEEIAGIIMRSRATVCRWCSKFVGGGITATLGHAPQPGRPSAMHDETIIRELTEGLASGRWVVADQVRLWLLEEHGVKLCGSAVRNWLGKLAGAVPAAR